MNRRFEVSVNKVLHKVIHSFWGLLGVMDSKWTGIGGAPKMQAFGKLLLTLCTP